MWKTMNYLRKKKSPKSQFYVDFGLVSIRCSIA